MEHYPFRTLVAAAAALAMALSMMLLGFPILLALLSGITGALAGYRCGGQMLTKWNLPLPATMADVMIHHQRGRETQPR
jgi:hypothetical protein